MKAPPFALLTIGLAISVMALAATNLSHSSSVADAWKSSGQLAAACYREGVAMGQLMATADRAKELGSPIPKDIEADLARGATNGCRETPSR